MVKLAAEHLEISPLSLVLAGLEMVNHSTNKK
jgi:hypothetical protein